MINLVFTVWINIYPPQVHNIKSSQVFFWKLCCISEYKWKHDSSFGNASVPESSVGFGDNPRLFTMSNTFFFFLSLHTLALQSCQLQTHQYHGYGMVIVVQIHSYLHQKNLRSHYPHYTQAVALCIDLIKKKCFYVTLLISWLCNPLIYTFRTVFNP